MNKRNKLGHVLAYVEGYHIRTILDKGNDSGKCAVFAGKHIVSESYVTNSENIEKLKEYIKLQTNVCNMVRKNMKIKGVKSLRTKKIKYKVYDENHVQIEEFKSKDKAIKFADLQK